MNKNNNLPIIKGLTYVIKCRSILLLYSIFMSIIINAQNVQYDSFPVQSQIFQRDDFNKAKVPIIGKVFTEDYTDISLLVSKDGKRHFWQKKKLSYQLESQKNAPFTFETEISAELSEYTYSLYLYKGKDSTQVREQAEIVCGDIILVYGQSNALASDQTEIDRFSGDVRFGRTAYVNYTNNEYLWLPTRSWNYWSAGLLGLGIIKQLTNKYKIPIGIINGAEGGKSIVELTLRDAKQHNNVSTIYGRLLKKAEGLGFAKKARMLVWRQGESEALDGNYKNEYPKNFEILRKQLLEDYPSLKKIYTFQNNIYFGNQPNAGNLRDFQRRIKDFYPDCEALATFGTVAFTDGLHYKLEGYEQSGEEVSRLIAHDFYKSSDTLEIYSPNIKKIQLTANKDSLILEFDKFQNLVFPQQKIANYTTLDLKNFIYLDGKSGNIASGRSSGNQIILKLKQAQDVQTVTYTPDFYTFDMIQFLPEAIPPITNSRGLRAFTFKDFPATKCSIVISQSTLTGKWDNVSKKKIELSWPAQNDLNMTFTLEKAVNTANFFVEIATLNNTQYIDYKVKRGIKYFYRVKIKQNNANTITYSNTFELTIPFDTANMILVNEDAVVVYPNPIQKGQDLKLDVVNGGLIKMVRLTDMNNTIFNKTTGDLTEYLFSFKTDNLHSGMYFIEVFFEDNTKLIKKFVVE